jgi:hypothetical protein
MFNRESQSSRISQVATLVAVLICVPAVASSQPFTDETLSGSWELRTACMNNHGKPGSCIEMKPGSLRFIFKSDGHWSSSAQDKNKTSKSGHYEIHGKRLILKNTDGSVYQDWQPDLSNDLQHFIFAENQLIETFDRVATTE